MCGLLRHTLRLCITQKSGVRLWSTLKMTKYDSDDGNWMHWKKTRAQKTATAQEKPIFHHSCCSRPWNWLCAYVCGCGLQHIIAYFLAVYHYFLSLIIQLQPRNSLASFHFNRVYLCHIVIHSMQLNALTLLFFPARYKKNKLVFRLPAHYVSVLNLARNKLSRSRECRIEINGHTHTHTHRHTSRLTKSRKSITCRATYPCISMAYQNIHVYSISNSQFKLCMQCVAADSVWRWAFFVSLTFVFVSLWHACPFSAIQSNIYFWCYEYEHVVRDFVFLDSWHSRQLIAFGYSEI